ncbi:PREDICTED: histone-lysine N-methyltransferase ATX5-like [Acropora digitifera]|uniref:histone-lysine N-methyltransferase ATX5-like n=1 Tax=Acropora digitifera TaxID=70779 RepID=UPI00077A0112|nr:PREDICTED: histone-lysine N-methyltransferase ATX5-like [Acropora digitifera]
MEGGSMVIEYIGSIIRNEVANRREQIYEKQNRGVYMFRIDSDAVIDATMAGGPARYINHSCSVSVRLCPALFHRSELHVLTTATATMTSLQNKSSGYL